MMTMPIMVVGFTSLMGFTALGLLDPLALPHLERSLGASTEVVGAIFMIPCIVFTLVSLVTEIITKRIGYRMVSHGDR